MGYWLGRNLLSSRWREAGVPAPDAGRTCDAGAQTEEVNDKGPAKRASTTHYCGDDDGEYYFTLKGGCVHLNAECTGLNFRSTELLTRRMCLLCKSRGRTT